MNVVAPTHTAVLLVWQYEKTQLGGPAGPQTPRIYVGGLLPPPHPTKMSASGVFRYLMGVLGYFMGMALDNAY